MIQNKKYIKIIGGIHMNMNNNNVERNNGVKATIQVLTKTVTCINAILEV